MLTRNLQRGSKNENNIGTAWAVFRTVDSVHCFGTWDYHLGRSEEEMKVNFKSTEATYGSLNFGETFVIDGIVYVKTVPSLHQNGIPYDLPSFGCSLEDGSLRYFRVEDYVHPINMEVIEI